MKENKCCHGRSQDFLRGERLSKKFSKNNQKMLKNFQKNFNKFQNFFTDFLKKIGKNALF